MENKGTIVDSVTVSREEYEELLEDSLFLQALRAAGVDNWDGYDYAIELLDEMTEEKEKRKRDEE